jgi:hypothetical protein
MASMIRRSSLNQGVLAYEEELPKQSSRARAREGSSTWTLPSPPPQSVAVHRHTSHEVHLALGTRKEPIPACLSHIRPFFGPLKVFR